MFTFLMGLAPDVLAIEAAGKITREDYREQLIPRAEALMARGPIKALCVIKNKITDYSLTALWDDQRFGRKHWRDLSHLAIVTDRAWIKAACALAAPLLPVAIRLFPVSELETAKAWITAVW